MNNNRLIRVLLILGLVAGISLAVIYRDQLDGAALEAWIRDAGAIAPLLFMLVYALAAVLFLPGSVITLAGPVLGTLYILTGATLGATLAFLIARYLASDWVAEDMTVRVHLLDDGVEVGRHSHQVPEGAVNLEALLGELIACGLQVSACGMALNDCALDESAMLPGIECGSMKALANWVKGSGHVMVF